MSIKLSDYSTDPPKGVDEEEIRDKTKELAKDIAKLQYDLYKESKQALLAVSYTHLTLPTIYSV